MFSAYNLNTKEANIYLELGEQMRERQLEQSMLDMGATQTIIVPYQADIAGQPSVYNKQCAEALFRVIQKSKEPGWTLVERGTPSVKPKAPAQTSTAEFLAQEREDLIAQETVMREDPGAFQHDGGYAGPILGKQKMAERSESPTSAGAGGSKRQRGSLVGFIKEHQQQWAEAMESAINEELERMDNEKTAKIDAITAERDSLAAKNAELTARINGFSAEKAALVDELDGVKQELAAKNEEMADNKKANQDFYNFWTDACFNARNETKKMLDEAKAWNAERDALVNELERVKGENQKLLDEAKASSDRYDKLSDDFKKLEETDTVLNIAVDTQKHLIQHIPIERAEWAKTVNDRERRIVQLETSVREWNDAFGNIAATIDRCRYAVTRSQGVLGDLNMDVMYLDGHSSEMTWVFSFTIQHGEQNVSKDALAGVFAVHGLKKCELETINGETYVFVKFARALESWRIKNVMEREFDTVACMGFICSSSRAASNKQSDTRKKWTEKKFLSFISKLRDVDFIRPARPSHVAAAAVAAAEASAAP
jgi:hypothetical protein